MTAQDRPTPSFKTLLLLAWPIVISRSSQVVVGVSDAILVSHLGEGAVAATTTSQLAALRSVHRARTSSRAARTARAFASPTSS